MKRNCLLSFLCIIFVVTTWATDEMSLSKALSFTKTATKTSQIILVVGDELSTWNKNASGTWKMVLSSKSGHGKNGFSRNRHEGDGTTPIGSFPILYAFGFDDHSNIAMDYRKITQNSYLSCERDETYNTWVESETQIDGEHLIDYYQYKYAMNIGFNINPTIHGKGTAIFLHIKSYDHWYTAGCISVPENIMKQIFFWAKNGTYIIIVEDESKILEF